MLTDEECEYFRRLPGSFNDMVRAIHDAGAERGISEALISVSHAVLEEREACANIFSDELKKYHPGNGKIYGVLKWAERHILLRPTQKPDSRALSASPVDTKV